MNTSSLAFYALVSLAPALGLLAMLRLVLNKPKHIKRIWMQGARCPDCGEPLLTDGLHIGCERTRFCSTKIAIKERL